MAKRIWTIDCETDPFKIGRVPKPFLRGAFDGQEYFEFENTIDLVNFIKDKPDIFYAHNGGKFDFHFLADHIKRNEKTLTSTTSR